MVDMDHNGAQIRGRRDLVWPIQLPSLSMTDE
jgi:hypothetical protein